MGYHRTCDHWRTASSPLPAAANNVPVCTAQRHCSRLHSWCSKPRAELHSTVHLGCCNHLAEGRQQHFCSRNACWSADSSPWRRSPDLEKCSMKDGIAVCSTRRQRSLQGEEHVPHHPYVTVSSELCWSRSPWRDSDRNTYFWHSFHLSASEKAPIPHYATGTREDSRQAVDNVTFLGACHIKPRGTP